MTNINANKATAINESLQRASYLRCYNKIVRHINKVYPLFVGYGYTIGKIEIGEL